MPVNQTGGEKVLLVVYGTKVQTPKLAVDAANELADLAFKFRRVGKSGGCNLNKHNSAYPLGVVV